MNVYPLSLTREEEKTLEQMYLYAPKPRLRQRALMVLLSAKGYCQKEISQIVRVSYPTARRYLHAYHRYGFLALYDEPKPGRPSRLGANQKSQLDVWFSDSPRACGFNQNNWTARLLRFLIIKTWGIKLSPERVRQIIKDLGYTLVRPRHHTRKADPVKKKSGSRFEPIQATSRGRGNSPFLLGRNQVGPVGNSHPDVGQTWYTGSNPNG